MKRQLPILFLGLMCILLGASASGRAQVSFSAGIQINAVADFDPPLTPLGSWVTLSSYGRGWRPAHVAITWRPYSDGRWEWTDLGWYWVSDEPWAWATYHYGTWVNDSTYGWVWIPGIEWAPAWVSWRESPDFVGWCPFGPGGVVLSPSLFVFVEIGRFRGPIRPSIVVVNNRRIISRTRGMSVNFRHETRRIGGASKEVVVNVGPSVEEIGKATGGPITPKPITEVVQATPVPENVPRTGEMDRPVLSEQTVEQWRERSSKESEKPAPTGREEPNAVQPGTEQPKPELAPGQPVPEKPGQVQPNEPLPTPPQQPLPPTGREEPQKPPQPQPGEQLKPQPGPSQPPPATPGQAQPNQPMPTPPQQPPPPTGRDVPQASPPQTGPGGPPPASPDQAQPNQSAPAAPQRPAPPTPSGPEQAKPAPPPPQAPPEQPPTQKPKEEPNA